MNELIEQLRAIVGVSNILFEGDLANWELDWRKRFRGKALAVVRPGSTAEVAAVVKLCAASGVPIVPQGGNTGLVGGSVPDGSGSQVALSLLRMNTVYSVDRQNMTVTAAAGCVLQVLQEAAEQAGLVFPLSLGSEGSCTIGGSEGTLGIITAATMKLFHKPAATATAWVAVPSVDAAVRLLSLARDHLGSGISGFELMGQVALGLVDKHYAHLRAPFVNESSFCVLVEPEDHESDKRVRSHVEAMLEAAMEAGLVTDAVVASNVVQAKQLWHARESIPLAQAEEGANIRHDISIPISRIADFCSDADAAVRRLIPTARLVNYGHIGDGNLHYNVQAPEGSDTSAFIDKYEERVSEIVYEQVGRFGGSISAEHGIGSAKVNTLAHHKAAVALDMMRAVKRALDPASILNPGRVIHPA